MIKLTEFDIKSYNEGYGAYTAKPYNSLNNVEKVHITNSDTSVNRIMNVYAFITDPQYGFLDLFNKPDSPWQEGFWKWWNNKKDIDYHEWFKICKYHSKYPKMLTGYILEYLESDRKESNDE